MKAALLFLTALMLSACGASQGPVVSSGERYIAMASDSGDAAIENYVLGVGDKIRVTVYNEPTLSGEFSVTPSGVLALPLVGDVPASGKTTSDVALAYQNRLADGYLRDPKVSMEVSTYRPFFILGEVKAPGQYPYAIGLTVLNAVATAQGFTPRASKGQVYIRRNGATAEVPYQVTPDLKVMPGDTVRFGERYF